MRVRLFADAGPVAPARLLGRGLFWFATVAVAAVLTVSAPMGRAGATPTVDQLARSGGCTACHMN